MPPDPTSATRPRPGIWRDGRWIVLVMLAAQLAGFFLRSPRLDYVQIAHRWGVLAIQPEFSDLYFIAGAGATYRAGGDPYKANTFDPLGRAYNYPPLWLHLSWHRTVSPDFIRMLALAMGVFGTVAFLAFLGPISGRRGLLLGVLACSPPVILAAQRANADILMVGLVALGLVLLRRGRRALGYAAFVAATWLKLYPLFALAVLLREPRERLRRVALIVITAAALCFVAYAGYLGRIFGNTPEGGLHSYGARVLAFWFAFFSPAYGWNVDRVLLGRVCSLLAVVVGLLAWRVARRSASLPPEANSSSQLDGFRAGAAVYVSTFLLSVSFDYRLLFLLLTVPWLASLAASRTADRRWGIAALVLVFGTMWTNGLFWKPLLLTKEASSWGLFFVLTVLLLRTLPGEWKARLRLA